MMVLTDDSPLVAELRAAAQRYAALARSAADGSQQVPGSAWTVRESVAHVATAAPRFAKFPQGTQRVASTPAEVAALNAEEIEALGDRTPGELAGLLENSVEQVISQIEGYGDQPPAFRFHGGCLIHADVALGILLGELVVHGWDLARQQRRSWPITRQQVSLIWSGVEPILPGWVDPARAAGHSAAYAVHLGDGPPRTLRFTNGTLTTTLPPRHRIDCHVGGDPAAILLVVYRRRSPWRAAMTGRVIAWGRRPWLALSLADRFCPP
jgi:uncharacterized protein (TIGR03083 family)